MKGRAIWFALFVLGSACAQSHATQGRQAFGRGDYKLAARELTLAAEEQPDDPLVWRELARAHMRSIEPEKALAAVENACRLDPKDDESRLVRGQARMALEQKEAALEDARFVATHGKNPRVLQETAILLLRLHQEDEALAAARRAIERSRDDPTAYANLAVLATEVGRNDVAGQAFAEGRGIHPEHVGLAEAHAAWLVTRGELDQARKTYKDLLAAHPQPGLIHLAIALLSHALGDLDDALTHSSAAVSAEGKNRADVHYTHVVVLRDAGNTAAAREHLADAQRRFPADDDLARLAKDMVSQ
jgi:tetratricopeptide (TPR) repeat protein